MQCLLKNYEFNASLAYLIPILSKYFCEICYMFVKNRILYQKMIVTYSNTNCFLNINFLRPSASFLFWQLCFTYKLQTSNPNKIKSLLIICFYIEFYEEFNFIKWKCVKRSLIFYIEWNSMQFQFLARMTIY